MLTAQERVMSSIDGIKRFTRSHLTDKFQQLQGAPRVKSRAGNKAPVVTKKPRRETVEALELNDSLRYFVDQAESFAPYSVLLGKCDDGLPLTLELTNPAPGSILIAGDEGSGKTRLLKAIVKSAALLNQPDRLQINIITQKPEEFQEFTRIDSCRHILPAEDYKTAKLIETLVELTDQRQKSSPGDPSIILAVDDLAHLSSMLNYEQTARLFRLVRHGPRSRIWVITCLTANRTGEVHHRLIEGFRTRLTGKTSSIRLSYEITGDDQSPAVDLEPGSQFCIPVNQDWLKFKICD